jgi:hypothetical protein
MVARQAHNLEIAGSNPAPATNHFHSANGSPQFSQRFTGGNG